MTDTAAPAIDPVTLTPAERQALRRQLDVAVWPAADGWTDTNPTTATAEETL